MIDNSYMNYVESLALKGEDLTFFNSGPIHAAIVMSRIFKYSKDTVRIFCGGFNGAVSNDKEYLNELRNFLSHNGKLKVLVESYSPDNNTSKVFDVFKTHPNKRNVEVRRTNSRIFISNVEKPVHFTVGDDRMLRVETDTSDFKAQVNFNSKESKLFSDTFDNIFITEGESVAINF